MRWLILALALFTANTGLANPQVVKLLELRTDDPRAWERLHRDSDSLPLTLEELEKLSKAGLKSKTIIEMMRTRRVLVVADADALLRLKKAGADDAMVAAVSAYALAPNQHFDLEIVLAVSTPHGVSQAPFLYVEAWHTVKKRQEAFLHSDLRGLLTRGARVEVTTDRSDPLLPQTVRTVTLRAPVKTRHPGKIALRVLMSKTPGLRAFDTLPDAAKARIQTLHVDYPGVSLDRRCRLRLDIDRDPLIRDHFKMRPGILECWWD